MSVWFRRTKQFRSTSFLSHFVSLLSLMLVLSGSIFGIFVCNSTNAKASTSIYKDCNTPTPTAGTSTPVTPTSTVMTSAPDTPTPTVITPTPDTGTLLSTPIPCQTTMTNYAASDGQILWAADWEQSSSQWSIHTGMPDWGNSSVQPVQNPVRQGQYAAKFTVNAGAASDGNERAEVSASQQNTGGYAGQDWYYSWSTYIPSIPNQATGWSSWTDITQWMDMRHNCSPPLQVDIVPGNNNTPQLIFDHELNSQQSPCDYSKAADQYPLGQLTYDQWIDFTVHIKWSEDPQVGFAQVWVNGQNVLPLTYMQTLDPNSSGVYMEQALYRPDRNGTNMLSMDATRRHSAYNGITVGEQSNSVGVVPPPVATTTPMPTASATDTPTVPTATDTPIVPTAAGTPTVPTATGTASGQATKFKGIFVFNGKNASTLSDNPYVAGTYLGYYWSQLEPQEGQYNWKQIDSDMQPWVANGKSVIIRMSTSGWSSWQPPDSIQGTPQWVYDMGVPSVKETDGALKPQYWNQTFLQKLNDFVKAYASHYDGNPHISAIEIGIGDGGETKPDTHIKNNTSMLQNWQSINYTNATWWNTIQQIIGIYTSAFHSTPLAIMPSSSFLSKESGYSESLVVNYAISKNLWLQDNGLVVNQQLADNWKKVPVIVEQRNPTAQSGDTLQQDVQTGLADGATILLIFSSDLAKSENQPILQQAAAMVQQQN